MGISVWGFRAGIWGYLGPRLSGLGFRVLMLELGYAPGNQHHLPEPEPYPQPSSAMVSNPMAMS